MPAECAKRMGYAFTMKQRWIDFDSFSEFELYKSHFAYFLFLHPSNTSFTLNRLTALFFATFFSISISAHFTSSACNTFFHFIFFSFCFGCDLPIKCLFSPSSSFFFTLSRMSRLQASLSTEHISIVRYFALFVRLHLSSVQHSIVRLDLAELLKNSFSECRLSVKSKTKSKAKKNNPNWKP